MRTLRLLAPIAATVILAACPQPEDTGEVGPADVDRDGFTVDEDCNDGNPLINPDATEIPYNGIDEDCSGADLLDADGDGFDAASAGGDDCDDTPALGDDPRGTATYPGADEVCDGQDNDCNEIIDDNPTDAPIYFKDADADSFGDPDTTQNFCEAPDPSWVTNSDDCDDADRTTFPDAKEICDTLDNDCDGLIDADDDNYDPEALATWYQDGDGDGFGSPNVSRDSCEPPAGFVKDPGDCNDEVTTINPAAPEICNELDDDCDGAIDEDGTEDQQAWYLDGDGDGYGDPRFVEKSCTQPDGYAVAGDDCDDLNPDISPGATEICNGIDDDCDEAVDDDDATVAVSSFTSFFEDGDGDGYGDPASTQGACLVPSGYVDNSDDCDDTAATVFPGAAETCNSADDDCDGTVDEDDAVDANTYYYDADGDGYGRATVTTAACSVPSGFAETDDDCDDVDGNTNPGATEVCNGFDDDCDGDVDDDDSSVSSASFTTFYADDDGDGFGDLTNTQGACVLPSGYVERALATDCDDSSDTVYPGADEFCNSVDDDCDGTTDEDDAVDADTWYLDSDGDTYGRAGVTTSACSQPTGYADDDDDCNDVNAKINPSATEVCNRLDDDCDGDLDDDDANVSSASFTTFYVDGDGDGFGDDANTKAACAQPTGTVTDDTDCDDDDDAVYPGADELCNSVDDDCDGTTDEDDATDADTWYFDSDGDGFGGALTRNACTQPTDYVDEDGDCDDFDDEAYPGADEVCNNADDDCDGDVDNEAIDANIYFEDADGDGFGNPDESEEACKQPSGFVTDETDCDDDDEDINEDAIEVCDDADNDCDGQTNFDFTVPDDYSTIQAAINASKDGEHICVLDDTYTESLDFRGKEITLEGESEAGTILDGGNSGRVVYMGSGENEDTVLKNVTIQNGRSDYGAGLYLTSAGPTLENVTFLENECTNAWTYCYGTAVYINNRPSNEMFWENITFEANESKPRYQLFGGGIYNNNARLNITDLVVKDQLIEPNTTNNYNADVYGGFYYGTSDGRIEIDGATFTDNVISHGGASSYSFDIRGGQFYAISNDHKVYLTDVVFEGDIIKPYTTTSNRTQYVYVYGGLFHGESESNWRFEDVLVDAPEIQYKHDPSGGQPYYAYLYGGVQWAHPSTDWRFEDFVVQDAEFEVYSVEQGGMMRFDSRRNVWFTDVDFVGNSVDVYSSVNGGIVWTHNYNTQMNWDGVLFEDNLVQSRTSWIRGGINYFYYHQGRHNDVMYLENTARAQSWIQGGMDYDNYLHTHYRRNVSYHSNQVRSTNSYVYGGLKYYNYAHSRSQYHYNLDVRDNSVESLDQLYGGVFYNYYQHHYMYNSVIAGNTFKANRGDIRGGISYATYYGHDYWYNNTLYNNTFNVANTSYNIRGGIRSQESNNYNQWRLWNNIIQDVVLQRGGTDIATNTTNNYIGWILYQSRYNYNDYVYNNFHNAGASNRMVYDTTWGWDATYQYWADYGPRAAQNTSHNYWNTFVDAKFEDVSSTDPLDWDLTLDSTSPVIDKGSNSYNGADPDGSTADMGAYGGQYADDW